jgi:hypothetical protein
MSLPNRQGIYRRNFLAQALIAKLLAVMRETVGYFFNLAKLL